MSIVGGHFQACRTTNSGRAKADLADAENAEKKKQEDACKRILSIEAQLSRGVDQLPMGRMEELVDWAIKRADEVGEETKPMVLVDKSTNHVRPRVTRHGKETHKRYLVNETKKKVRAPEGQASGDTGARAHAAEMDGRRQRGKHDAH